MSADYDDSDNDCRAWCAVESSGVQSALDLRSEPVTATQTTIQQAHTAMPANAVVTMGVDRGLTEELDRHWIPLTESDSPVAESAPPIIAAPSAPASSALVPPPSDPEVPHLTIIAFDFETVPQLDKYRAALANGPDAEAAMTAANAEDKAALQRALGPGAKMGRVSKRDALVKFAESFVEDYAENCAKMGMDPMRLAICTAAIYTETRTGAQGYLFSWGSEESAEQYTCPVTGKGFELQRYGIGAPNASLDTMSDTEWLAHERILLLGFWHVMGQFATELTAGTAILASHNGARFDVPALRWRTIAHRFPLALDNGVVLPPVRPTVRWSVLEPPRYRTRPHMDTFAIASNWDTSRMSGCGLEAVSAAVGLPIAKHDGMDGAEVFPEALVGHWDRINTYCIGDACTTHAIAQAFVDGGL